MLPGEPVPAPPADPAPAAVDLPTRQVMIHRAEVGERLHDSFGVTRRGHPAPPEDPFPASVSWETVPSDGALIFLPANAKEMEGPPERHRYQICYPRRLRWVSALCRAIATMRAASRLKSSSL